MDLGTYTAENKLGEQQFALETRAWVRYLKIRFMTHYSKEFFCTLSQIKYVMVFAVDLIASVCAPFFLFVDAYLAVLGCLYHALATGYMVQP